MKTVFLLFAAVVVGICAVNAQEARRETSPLAFDATEWGFGEIREEAGPVSHTFEFSNTGSHPVAIDRASASCGCTTPEYSRGTIAPGAKGSIKVSFDPTGYPGNFSKTIGIVSGGGKYVDYLTITGRVAPHPNTIEDEYPHDMGGGVRLDNVFFAFRTLAQGNSASMVARYVNTSDREVTLALEPVDESGYLAVHAPESVCAGCRGDITLTYDLSERQGYGPMHDAARLAVNGVPSQKTIYTAFTGIDDFSGIDADNAPRLTLDGYFHDFGQVRRRPVPYIRRLVASNDGAQVLHIRSVGESAGLRCTLRAGMTIAPGATLPFEVVFYSDKYYSGRVNESIIVITDDPARPSREIRVAAEIK